MKGFDEFASDYRTVLDRSVGSARFFADGKARWLAQRLGPNFDGRILDFGCGIGLLAAAIHRAVPNAQLTGFDLSQASIAALPAEILQVGRFTANLADLSQDFSAIVVSNVLHHVAVAERDSVLQDLASRLRPGGSLVIFEHNPLNPATRLVVARCAFDDDAILLWPKETLQRLTDAQLSQITREYIAFFPPSLSGLCRFEPSLARLPFGSQYVACGVRP